MAGIKREPRRGGSGLKLLLLVLVAVCAGWGAAAYMLQINPEVRHLKRVVAEQNRYAEASGDGRRVLVIGGSSVSFSINPELLEKEFGLRVCNLGLQAGTGRGLHFEQALQHARPGDVVLVAFEMSGWTGEEGDWITPLGSQVWHAALKDERESKLREIGIEPAYDLTALRPGGKHCLTMGIKLAARQPLFRYGPECIRPGAYLIAPDQQWNTKPRADLVRYDLDKGVAEVFSRFVKRMKQNQVEVVVSLPWHFTAPEIAEAQRTLNAQLIHSLEKVAPCLNDPQLGVATEVNYFADTRWHLNRLGASLRTRSLGEGLVQYLD